MVDFIVNLDKKIINFFGRKNNNVFLNSIMIAASFIGNGGMVWLFIAAMLLRKPSGKIFAFLIIGSLITEFIIVEVIIKNIVKRARPIVEDISQKMLIKLPITYSFPSGHTASSFAVTTVLALLSSHLFFAALPIAILISFSRVYLRVHYPSDVIAGVLVGFISGSIAVLLYRIIF